MSTQNFVHEGHSLAVQWLRLHASNAQGKGQGTEILRAAQCGQINK